MTDFPPRVPAPWTIKNELDRAEIAKLEGELAVCVEDNDGLRAEVERLRAALAFYARPIAYQGDNVKNEGQDAFTPPDRPYIQSVGRDGGEVARRALENKPTIAPCDDAEFGMKP